MSTTTIEAPWTRDEFVAVLRKQAERYYHTHPFHKSMNAGHLTKNQIQVWVANRFYYQKNIPLKDAAILSNCPEITVRRAWLQRIIDHDGAEAGQGGIEDWLRLAEALGVSREEVLDERYLVPGVRFAVDAYVNFARTHSWIEAVASSLTEVFSPDLMKEPLDAFEQRYDWINNAGLTYLRKRLVQGPRDASSAIDIVVQYAQTRELQERAVSALIFKCDVLWSMLDAIDHEVEVR
ncbi:MAG: pyrroloquinoline-quinone synthase PqqC [Ktedonobacteraceae bacterium]